MMSNPQFRVQTHPPAVFVVDGERRIELPALWLRERCQDAEHLDAVTQQRLFNPHDLAQDLRLIGAEALGEQRARLAFSDGHTGDYDLTRLVAEFDSDDGLPKPHPWDASIDRAAITFDWERMADHACFRDSLEAFLRYGVIILEKVPTEDGTLVEVGESYGQVRSTNFGQYFEVFSRPASNDLAYRPVPLAPHTDNPYRNPVPGIQLLHCLVNETSGGLSTLVDSLSVVEQLRTEDPEGYRLLASVPVRFRFVDDEVELIERRPMIHLDPTGRPTGVHYSPRLDALPLMDETTTRTFHRARRRLGELFSHPLQRLAFPLQAGELMMFDNNRLLHGRTAYDPNEGRRHLQGCYIDRDGPAGRYRALCR